MMRHGYPAVPVKKKVLHNPLLMIPKVKVRLVVVRNQLIWTMMIMIARLGHNSHQSRVSHQLLLPNHQIQLGRLLHPNLLHHQQLLRPGHPKVMPKKRVLHNPRLQMLRKVMMTRKAHNLNNHGQQPQVRMALSNPLLPMIQKVREEMDHNNHSHRPMIPKARMVLINNHNSRRLGLNNPNQMLHRLPHPVPRLSQEVNPQKALLTRKVKTMMPPIM